MKMTNSQFQEMEYHIQFESCPKEVDKLISSGVKDLTKYSEDSLKWIFKEAEDYEELFKTNSDFYYAEGYPKDGLKWNQFAKSMKNLQDKIII
tara:strand:+ start:422 stop:700 length:279 start_codon:yes stop_codon:yes gene_type:complete